MTVGRIIEGSMSTHIVVRERPPHIVTQAQQGIAGPAGGTINTVININVPSTTWTLVHNLNKYPVLVVFDEAHDIVDADYSYVDLNVMTVNFSVPTSGKAILT